LTAAAAATLWLILILLLHFTKPEFDPRTRMISEYAIGLHGWVMQVAFFCMALSCGALAATAWAIPAPLGSVLLIICGVGFAGAGIFVTDPVSLAESPQTRSGALHVLFAFIVIAIFPIMATVVGIGVADTASSGSARHFLPALSALPWSGFLIFLAGGLISKWAPRTPLGYLERFLVLAYSLWLVAVALISAASA
jgi:nitrate reductase NapE component